jgi:hypothetical protein
MIFNKKKEKFFFREINLFLFFFLKKEIEIWENISEIMGINSDCL